jgi:diazepam-binding inhibitor (GABA receptor modulator, acyl-CoA-binding protein)
MLQLEEKFLKAKEESKSLSEKPSNEILLQLYGLYKQGTVGDAEGEGPTNPFDFISKAKFNAWQGFAGKSKADAQQAYIDLIEKLKA